MFTRNKIVRPRRYLDCDLDNFALCKRDSCFQVYSRSIYVLDTLNSNKIIAEGLLKFVFILKLTYKLIVIRNGWRLEEPLYRRNESKNGPKV